MNRPTGTPQDRAGNDADGWEEEPFEPLTREQAQALRAKHPSTSPWRVVAVQASAGVLCVVLVWAVTQRSAAGWSALYGVAATVLPNVLLARGMTRGTRMNPGAAAFGFMFWEMVKIAVAVAMLAAASRVVPGLSWPALLVAMIVCTKASWLALLWRRRPADETTERS